MEEHLSMCAFCHQMQNNISEDIITTLEITPYQLLVKSILLIYILSFRYFYNCRMSYLAFAMHGMGREICICIKNTSV